MVRRVVLVCALIGAFTANLGEALCSSSTARSAQFIEGANESFEDFKYVPCYFIQKYKKALQKISNLEVKLITVNQIQSRGRSHEMQSEQSQRQQSSSYEDYDNVISGLKNSLSASNKEVADCKETQKKDQVNYTKGVKDLEKLLDEANNKVVLEIERLKSCNNFRETEKNKCTAEMQLLNKRIIDLENKLKSQTNEIKSCNNMRETEKTDCAAKIQDLTKKCNKAGQNLNMVQLSTGTYHFSKDMKMNWSAAKQFCIKNGLQLLSIENAAENNAIIAYVKKIGFPKDDKFYMSGIDEGQGGKWFWDSTGKAFTFTDWVPPNPFPKDQHCTTIWHNSRIGWDNEYCHLNLKFICELPK